MRKTLILAAVACAGSSFAQLYNNGPLVTHPGQGPGGIDVSMASAIPNSGGNNTNATIANNFAVADDFTVTGAGWNVSNLISYAYDTGAPGGVARFTSVLTEIRLGSPTGALVGTGVTSWGLAGINRVFNGTGNLLNADRQVQRITSTFNVNLAPGTYWFVQSIQTTGSAWTPYVMDPNPLNANDPLTRVGNSQIRNTGVWAPGTVTTGGWNQAPELPFIVNGSPVPEPATMAALGLGVAAMLRRRRAKK